MTNTDSCGVLLYSLDGSVLLCHATGRDHWDPPMGRKEPDESPLDAAQRELKEETGLVFPNDRFTYAGRFGLDHDKHVCLFSLLCEADEIDLNKCVCSSFVGVDGERIPEVDKFEWVQLEDIGTKVGKKLYAVLKPLVWHAYNSLISVHNKA